MRILRVFILSMLYLSTLLYLGIGTSSASSTVINVPQDFSTIQAAINAASTGDTVYVSNGTYNETVVLNKTIVLKGEARDRTIVDGQGSWTVIWVQANFAELRDITIQNGQLGLTTIPNSYGILLQNLRIRNNSDKGIDLRGSHHIISDSILEFNGLGLYVDSVSNIMKGNSFSNTTGGCALYFLGADNTIYHNNFYNSSGIVTYDNINRWDNGAEGNYWADYAGEDLNGDGIGDTFVPHRGVDRYPLMDPWNSVRIFTVMINQSTYNVTTFSESTIASFSLNQSEKTLGFNITSADTGFCNVTIPRAVLNDTLTVFIDGAQTDSIFKQNATHSLVWFAHEHGTHSVKIKSISVIPSELSVSVGASTLYIGFKVNVYGRLTYANGTGISNARILLSYSVTGGDSWADITSVTTGASGNFSVQWIPSATGMYIVRAIYAGNQTYSTHILATTVLVNLAVLPFEEQYVFSVSSNSTVSAFSFNSTTRELRFTVNGESGTDGYVDMTISKSLVQNITDLKIYLNGTEISYVTSSTDDSWLIHFSYHHSTHSVLVSLGSLQGVQVFPWWLLALLAVVLGIFALAIVVFKRKSLRSTRSSSALSAR